MKKILIICIVLVVALALAIPAVAQTKDTAVEVLAGTGTPPIVKAKWETPDDGDPLPDHGTPGTQVQPIAAYGAQKEVRFCAVVTDPQGVLTVNRVYADVYHPACRPADVPSFKYQLELFPLEIAAGVAAWDEAIDWNLVTMASGFTATEIREELVQGDAFVFCGTQYIDYHQPWGCYYVKVLAYDNGNNESLPLWNSFDYIQVSGAEFDFDSVNYGSIEVCTNKWKGGDAIFDPTEDPSMATVRNIGNTLLTLQVQQDDMGLGQTSGVWNVEYDARLGDAIEGTAIVYEPDQEVTLPDVLGLCNTKKMDFSIHIKKGSAGIYTGYMELGWTYEPFPECPGPPGDAPTELCGP
jgi:hypothetical protein